MVLDGKKNFEITEQIYHNMKSSYLIIEIKTVRPATFYKFNEFPVQNFNYQTLLNI